MSSFQNNDLNTNTWDNNRAGLAKAIIHDNRYGARDSAAPIVKNKTSSSSPITEARRSQ